MLVTSSATLDPLRLIFANTAQNLLHRGLGSNPKGWSLFQIIQTTVPVQPISLFIGTWYWCKIVNCIKNCSFSLYCGAYLLLNRLRIQIPVINMLVKAPAPAPAPAQYPTGTICWVVYNWTLFPNNYRYRYLNFRLTSYSHNLTFTLQITTFKYQYSLHLNSKNHSFGSGSARIHSHKEMPPGSGSRR